MTIPAVSTDVFDEALAECTQNPNNPKSEKRGWNYGFSESFMKDLPELYNMLVAAINKNPDSQIAGSFALNLTTVIHHAYKLSGAKFAPLTKEEVVAFRHNEEYWLMQVRKLPLPLAQESEEEYFRNRSNGEVLKAAIDMMRDFASMHRPQNPQIWSRSLEVARLSLGAAQAALNASIERAE